MDTRIFFDEDCKKDLILSKKLAIIGYGNQGEAHAKNLRSSGANLILGLRKNGQSWQKAKKDGFRVFEIGEAVKQSDVVVLLIPDENQKEVFKSQIELNLKSGAYLTFAHGFSIHYKQIIPNKNINVIMISPKGPGYKLREDFKKGFGLASLVAVENDASGDSLDLAISYACAIGSGKIGIMQTSFKEETQMDLFGEQAVICGGVSSLVQAGFQTLVQAGYSKEVAYFECFHELKLVVDLMHKGGLEKMSKSISNTAEYGALVSGEKVINEHSKKAMSEILEQIQDGSFAKKFISETEQGYPNLKKERERLSKSQIEKTGSKIRSLMPWTRSENDC